MSKKVKSRPPHWASSLLEWYCSEELIDEIQGDLNEQFQKNLQTLGPRKARLKYILDVFRFFRPSRIKKTVIGMNYHLLPHYFKVAGRVFSRDKAHTLTNILGLALAICCSCLIILWVQDELKYNRFFPEHDRVCFVMVNVVESGAIQTWTNTPHALKEVLQDRYPAIEKAASVSRWTSLVLRHEPDNLEPEGVFASPELFEVFPFPFRQGSYLSLFENKNSIVISARLAESYFGPRWDKVDRTGSILINVQGEQFELAGIFEDIPTHSTLRFDYVIPMEYRLSNNPDLREWRMYANHLYVRLANGYTLASANANVVNTIAENNPDDAESEYPLFLQSFGDLYLYSDYENGQIKGGRIEYVRLLAAAAILILLLASINFINLTTARSAKRSREAGLRKVMGAKSRSIGLQFMLESVLITFMAFILSILVIYLALPWFNQMAGKSIENIESTKPVLAGVVVTILLGVVSGFYPSVYMASISPLRLFRGSRAGNKSNSMFRKGLVAFQYVITIVMAMAAITVYLQTEYIFSKNIGLDRENVIMVSWKDKNSRKIHFSSYRDKLRGMPGIKSATAVNQDPLNIGSSTNGPSWEGAGDHNDVYFNIQEADPDFVPTLGIEIKEGRNFSWHLGSDTANCLINEAAAIAMGLTEPVGKGIRWDDNSGIIIGVLKDFHFKSLHTPIEPLIVRFTSDNWLLLVRAEQGKSEEALASLSQLHDEFTPDRRFDFKFLDAEFDQQYRSELLVKQLVLWFTVVAVVIACLGQLSLISYTAESKTKEIGIRKVLGASAPVLVHVLLQDFVWLIAVSAAVAIPIGAWLMRGWLDLFAYRIELHAWIFIASVGITFFLTLLTVSRTTLKTAAANPVSALRHE